VPLVPVLEDLERRIISGEIVVPSCPRAARTIAQQCSRAEDWE
jgi:hypothetical protein